MEQAITILACASLAAMLWLVLATVVGAIVKMNKRGIRKLPKIEEGLTLRDVADAVARRRK